MIKIVGKKLTGKTAKQYSGNVPDEEAFVTQSGKKISSMYGLYDVLSEMSNEEFEHHVNSSKNDFKNWIFHVVKDNGLAGIIAPLKKKQEILNVIEIRIEAYKKAIEAEKKAKDGKVVKSIGLKREQVVDIKDDIKNDIKNDSKKEQKKDEQFKPDMRTGFAGIHPLDAYKDLDIKNERRGMLLLGIAAGLLLGMIIIRILLLGV